MGHQPYPSPARGLHQLDRHHAKPAAAALVKTCQHPGEQIDITTWADAAVGQSQLMCASCGGVRSVPDPADTTEPPLSDPDGIVD